MAKDNKVIYLVAPNKYNFGSFMQGIGQGKGLGKFGSQYAGLSSDMQGALNGMAGALGQIGGSAIAGGLESDAGNVISGLSGVASMIPGPWGAVAGAGLGLVGGLVNKAFGTKEDKEKHQRIDQATNYLSTFNSRASNFDEVTGPQAMSLDSSVYEGGWFSKGKAARKNRELARKAQEALDKANRDVVNNVTTLQKSQMDNLESGYFALGGPLFMPVMGAIDYEIAQRRLSQQDLKDKDTGRSVPQFYALGGPLQSYGANWTNGITIVDAGGSHESNPYEGVQMGTDQEGKPNLVEEGEVIYKDYVFSDRIPVPDAVRQKYKLRGTKDMTFADAARKAQKPSAERPNDPIEMRGLEDIMGKLMYEQERVRSKKNGGPQGLMYAFGGNLFPWGGQYNAQGMPINDDGSVAYVIASREPDPEPKPGDANYWEHVMGTTTPAPAPKVNPVEPVIPQKTKSSWLTGLRYLPALGAGIGVFSDLMGWTNKPDYSNADMILDVANNLKDVTYQPIGDYMTYRPLDRLFYANQLGAQAGATRRGILNTSGGNRGQAMAGLLAADYNAQTQLGNLFRQAEEYNLAQREKVATFNRATNMFNSEQGLKAQIANRSNDEIRLKAAQSAATIRDAVDARVSAARSANLTNLFDSLGNIGIDAYNRQDRDMLIKSGVFGTLSQKPAEWSASKWKAYQEALNMKAQGGRIKKKRRGLTI